MPDDIIYLTEDFEPVDKDDPRMAMVKVRYPDGRVVFGFPDKEEQPKKNGLFVHGGPGSGFRGHKGRPGQVGGSQDEDGAEAPGVAPELEEGHYYHGTNAKAAESILKSGIDPKRVRVGTASATNIKSEALFHAGRHASGEHGSAMAPWEEDAVLVVVDYPLQEGFDPGEYSTREKIPASSVVRLEYYKQSDYKKDKGRAVPYKVVNNPRRKYER